jgi:uncharacterized protein YkwD
MKHSPVFSVIVVMAVLVVTGCNQIAPSPTHTPDAGPVIVSTLVVQTLTAMATSAGGPSGMVSATPTIAAVFPTLTPVIPPTATSKANATATPTPVVLPVEPSATPTAQPSKTIAPTPTPTSVVASPVPDCIDKAAFVSDATIPDNTLLPIKSPFTKAWRIKNVGTCSWGTGYQLVFARGNILGGPPSAPLPAAAPGETIDVSVNLMTPPQGGTYAGDWQFQNPGGRRFGVNSHGEDFIFVVIKVDWGPGIGPTATPPPVDCDYQRNTDYDSQLLQSINLARAANGAAPLTLQTQLTAAALEHSSDMACNNFLDHMGSNRSSYSSRIRGQGYNAKTASENIFAGGDAQTAFNWWMDSPIHRANILDKSMTQIGIASVTYSKSTFGVYYTLTFARP